MLTGKLVKQNITPSHTENFTPSKLLLKKNNIPDKSQSYLSHDESISTDTSEPSSFEDEYLVCDDDDDENINKNHNSSCLKTLQAIKENPITELISTVNAVAVEKQGENSKNKTFVTSSCDFNKFNENLQTLNESNTMCFKDEQSNQQQNNNYKLTENEKSPQENNMVNKTTSGYENNITESSVKYKIVNSNFEQCSSQVEDLKTVYTSEKSNNQQIKINQSSLIGSSKDEKNIGDLSFEKGLVESNSNEIKNSVDEDLVESKSNEVKAKVDEDEISGNSKKSYLSEHMSGEECSNKSKTNELINTEVIVENFQTNHLEGDPVENLQRVLEDNFRIEELDELVVNKSKTLKINHHNENSAASLDSKLVNDIKTMSTSSHNKMTNSNPPFLNQKDFPSETKPNFITQQNDELLDDKGLSDEMCSQVINPPIPNSTNYEQDTTNCTFSNSKGELLNEDKEQTSENDLGNLNLESDLSSYQSEKVEKTEETDNKDTLSNSNQFTEESVDNNLPSS